MQSNSGSSSPSARHEESSEAEETLAAIRAGTVDALFIGKSVYTLSMSSAVAHRMGQDVLAQMEDAVMAFDEVDRLIYANRAAERQYGLDAHGALGLSKDRIFTDGETAVPASPPNPSGHVRSRLVHRLPDGSEFPVEAVISPLRNARGEMVGRLHVIRDVTEQERAAEAIRQGQVQLQAALEALTAADQRKTEFLAILAHELRNPLSPICNSVYILKRAATPQVHAMARDVIERQANQLIHLVDDLLDINRITQGKIELRLETVDLAAVARHAIETSRPNIDARRHVFNASLPTGDLQVRGDATRLCQVIANLLNNAAKYTPEGGRIEVEVAQRAGVATVSVKDNGVGIPRDMLDKVFDMFAQVRSDSDRSQGGLGIGLALVRQLMQLHGGNVYATSAGTGQGSEFRLVMPLAEAALAA